MQDTTNTSIEVQAQKKTYKSPVTIEHGKVVDKTQSGAPGLNAFDSGCS